MEARPTRERIIEAAAKLLTEGGREAVSTRAVCAAAGVQAPTLYRIFGDKHGLLEAVASNGFETYLRNKAALEQSADPVEDLRRGWDLHLGFGLAHPAFYTLIYGEPRPGVESPAAKAAAVVLAGQVRRIAEAGRLQVSEERAAHLIHAAGSGMTLTLIALSEDQRDPALSTLARESIIAAVTTDPPADPAPSAGPVSNAVALRSFLPHTTALTPTESALLADWLDRIVAEA